jgi:iron complex outermembrane receptor protein
LRALLLGCAACSFATAAHAQDEDGAAADAATEGDDFHGPEIVVTAGGLERLDVVAGTATLEGDVLHRNLDGQIGEILSRTPGVSATSFSPGASRPVLRGLQGDRVRVLVDGIGAIDASNTSTDHAVTIDPLTAQRIEVLRGPAVLLYGSSAIGGAVNVIDKRIPRSVPQEPVHIDALASADTAFDLREGGASVDLPLAPTLALHLDGSYRETSDVEIAGFVLSRPLRQDLLEDAAEEAAEGHEDEAAELRTAAEARGRLPNSATETYSLGAGLAWIGESAHLGASVGYYDTVYGVPLRPGAASHDHGHDDEHDHEDDHGADGETHAHEHGDVSIDLRQWRVDVRGAVELGSGPFEQVTTRWGYSDYTHTEFEGDEVGTEFFVEGIEGRLELIQRERDGWRGSIGGQIFHRDFEAIGAEAFVPANTTKSLALFTLQEWDLDPFGIELGGRYDRTRLTTRAPVAERTFDTASGAIGLTYSPAPGLRVGLNGSRSARAPSAEELFAQGPHIATQQFEIGNPDLSQETALGLEAYARARVAGADLALNVYRTWFDAFVYLAATGAELEGLPVYRQSQQDARNFGIEAQASAPLGQAGGFRWVADLQGDYVRATLDDGTAVPRTPPLSLLGALEAQSDAVDLRGEVQWFAAQNRTAPLESASDSFAHVNLSVAWKPLRGTDNVTVMLQANNLFDAEGRRHASFTRDFVPLAGRNVKLSVRTSF